MKVAANTPAPDFKVNDVYGQPVSLSQYKGQKVHLVFYRFSGCPFCNLRFHQINKLTPQYEQNKVALLSVYESSAKNMLDMIAGEQFYSRMIPNTDSSLYRLYQLDRSLLGLIRFLLFNGGLAQAVKGMKLFKNKVATDGHTDRLEAEFLIDENGKVVTAHYGKIPGDYLPISAIEQFIING